MAGAPPPLPSSRPKGAYVPPPIPSNRPKVAYVHPFPSSTPEPPQEEESMKPKQHSNVINTNQYGSSGGGGQTMAGNTLPPDSLGGQLQAALKDRMMNNLNQMSSKPNPGAKPVGLDNSMHGQPVKPGISQKPSVAHKPSTHSTPAPSSQPFQSTPTTQPASPSRSSFGNLFGGSSKPQQPHPQSQQTLNSVPLSQPAGQNLHISATSQQKKAAANYSWNVAKDVSKNVSAKDVFATASLFGSAFSNNGKVSASKEQQAASARVAMQASQSAAKNVTAKEVGHASSFVATNAKNNMSTVSAQNSQQSSVDMLAELMGSRPTPQPVAPNPTARARPKPSSPSVNVMQQNPLGGLPPPPSSPKSQQRVFPQPQPGPTAHPRPAPRAPPTSAAKPLGVAAASKPSKGSPLIDFSDFAEPAKLGPPALPKSKAQGVPGALRTKPTIIRPSANRAPSPAAEQQQKKNKAPPRPSGPPTKKQAPARPRSISGVSARSAGSTPPRPSGLKPKRKAPPRPGGQNQGKKAPPPSKKESLPPRPGPGHPLYNMYMGSEPHGLALYDYQGQEADELSFKTNDVIILVKRIDAAWLIGKCNNKEGMFPSQYIKVIKDLNESKQEDDYDGPQAVAIFGFKASAADELSFDEGAVIKLLDSVGTVWFKGELNGKTGIFPSNHVEVIVPLPSSESPSPVTTADTGSGPRCRATFDYSSENADDLAFNKGAIIRLTQRVGDEWYRGEVNGRSGIFPAAFIEVLEDLPLSGSNSNRASPTTGNEVRAIFDFTAADSTELSFKDGDRITVTAQVGAEWLEGELNGKKGRFPANFVDRVPPNLPQASDIKMEAVEAHCVVSFNFDAAGEDEMTLRAGEKVILLERIGDDWLRGKIDSRVGIFPRSFVDIIVDLPSAGATPTEAKALFDFQAEADDELSFKAGDMIKVTERVNDEWLMGQLGGKSGRFPSSFVDISSS